MQQYILRIDASALTKEQIRSQLKHCRKVSWVATASIEENVRGSAMIVMVTCPLADSFDKVRKRWDAQRLFPAAIERKNLK